MEVVLSHRTVIYPAFSIRVHGLQRIEDMQSKKRGNSLYDMFCQSFIPTVPLYSGIGVFPNPHGKSRLWA